MTFTINFVAVRHTNTHVLSCTVKHIIPFQRQLEWFRPKIDEALFVAIESTKTALYGFCDME